jgi:hypothetical protein
VQDLIIEWRQQFFISPLQYLLVAITLIISIRKHKSFKQLKFLPLYSATLLLVLFSHFFDALSPARTSIHRLAVITANWVDYSFTLVEMLVFSNLFYQAIQNRIFKRCISFSNLFFFIIFILMPVLHSSRRQGISEESQAFVYTIESILLLAMSIYFFVTVFGEMRYVDFRNEPIFWIATGTLFFMGGSLPYSLLENYIRQNYPDFVNTSYTIFHIFYVFLFLMIIRAYRCKPAKAK